MDSSPPNSDRPANSSSVHWLDDFMAREGSVRDPVPILGERRRLGRPQDEKREPAYQPSQEDDDTGAGPRYLPAVVGAAALLAVLGLGGFAYVWFAHASHAAKPQATGIALDQSMRRSEPMAADPPQPKPMRSPAPPAGPAEQPRRTTESALPSSTKPSAAQKPSVDLCLLGGVASPVWGDTASSFPGYPQQAFGLLPTALSDRAGAAMINAAMSGVTRAPLVAKATSQSSAALPKPAPPSPVSVQRPTQPPALAPAVVAPAALTAIEPKPAVPRTAFAGSSSPAEQRNPDAARPPATPPARAQPAVGAPLHLQIVYASLGPQEAKAVAALQARIRGQVGNITTWGASEWPVRHELVVYFFPDDRAAASLIAASLAQITIRTAPLMLLRTKSAPQPGTVEILLPLRSGEDLKNDNL